jgi:hypothetical protein
MINIVRDEPAPASLKDQTSYRNPDTIAALHRIFKGKCYLTERVFDYPEEMEIDHFLTREDDSTQRYSWENLYPIDQKANKSRPKSSPSGGYLDPCNPADDVESDIIYKVEFGGNTLFKPKDSANKKAANTAQLLNHVHEKLRPTIAEKHHAVVNAVARWNTAKSIGDVSKEYEEELVLRKLLSRNSHFTMLMRSIWAVANDPLLVDFFDKP